MPHLSTAQRLFCVPRKHFGDLQLLSLCPPRFHVVVGQDEGTRGMGERSLLFCNADILQIGSSSSTTTIFECERHGVSAYRNNSGV